MLDSMRTTILFLFLMVLGCTAQAQEFTQTIRGTVKDHDSQAPLEGTTVTLFRGDSLITGAFSDVEGKFKITGVVAGRYTLRTAYVGYEPATIPNIVVNMGHELVLNISMTEAVITTVNPSYCTYCGSVLNGAVNPSPLST